MALMQYNAVTTCLISSYHAYTERFFVTTPTNSHAKTQPKLIDLDRPFRLVPVPLYVRNSMLK